MSAFTSHATSKRVLSGNYQALLCDQELSTTDLLCVCQQVELSIGVYVDNDFAIYGGHCVNSGIL